MANPFFNVLGGNQTNIMQILQQFKSNPAQFLMQSKFNIPKNIMNDPNAIINHLVSSGQVSQSSYNRAYSMAKQFGMK